MSRAILKTAFVFVFAAIIIPTLLIGQEQADSKTKNYYGILDAKLRVFRFVVSVAEDNSSATLKSLDEGQQVFKLEDFSIGDKMSFKLKRTVAEYSGSFNKDKNQFVGKWKQGGNELDLNFLLVEKTPDENTTEIWEGEINTGVQKLKLRFKLFDEKSKYPVVMDSVTQRVGGFTGTTQNAEGKMFFFDSCIAG